jgi:hypothetical protein
VESNWVHSALRPLIGLLYLPLVIMMMENLVEWRLAGETEVLGEDLPQRHFVHHKCHLTRPGMDRTRAAAVGSQRLTAWAMARPYYTVSTLWNSSAKSERNLLLSRYSPIQNCEYKTQNISSVREESEITYRRVNFIHCYATNNPLLRKSY